MRLISVLKKKIQYNITLHFCHNIIVQTYLVVVTTYFLNYELSSVVQKATSGSQNYKSYSCNH